MDNADMAQRQMISQRPSRKDPLEGIDLLKEYDRIKRNASRYSSRIRDMIKDRVEKGI